MTYYQLVQIHQNSNSKNRKKPATQINAIEAAKKIASATLTGNEAPLDEVGADHHSSECDSNTEVEAVVQALKGYAYRPIATYTPPFVSRQYKRKRLLLMQNPSFLEGNHHSLN
ncbi:hypothetical protein DSO57_1019811 [Entomophthora muscae]|uniref:Uncharacterized protein n=1 Tax=Entomophthora muscae TaxID=34485 RepID=A0ACC2S621_9FUNG|nr:hypothetical protein DSO57_1019811 [Entomophthora muscae]